MLGLRCKEIDRIREQQYASEDDGDIVIADDEDARISKEKQSILWLHSR